MRRLIDLHGTHNLRDTGGLPAQPGRTRWGKLYRSDALHRLDDDDRRELAARQVGLVLDLRHDTERERLPSALGDLRARVVSIDVLGCSPEVFFAADAHLDGLYDYLVDERGPALVATLRVIAHSGSTPIIVHCTAGKDRTGLVVALALTLAGVDRTAVIADYAATERHLPGALLDQVIAGLRAAYDHPAVNLELLVRSSPPAALGRLLDRIEARHGSVAGYARAHGLTDAEIALLIEVLVGR